MLTTGVCTQQIPEDWLSYSQVAKCRTSGRAVAKWRILVLQNSFMHTYKPFMSSGRHTTAVGQQTCGKAGIQPKHTEAKASTLEHLAECGGCVVPQDSQPDSSGHCIKHAHAGQVALPESFCKLQVSQVTAECW